MATRGGFLEAVGLFAALAAVWWALTGASLSAWSAVWAILAGAIGAAVVWRLGLVRGGAGLAGFAAIASPLQGLGRTSRFALLCLGLGRGRPGLVRARVLVETEAQRARLVASLAGLGATAADLDETTVLAHVADEDAHAAEAIARLARRDREPA